LSEENKDLSMSRNTLKVELEPSLEGLKVSQEEPSLVKVELKSWREKGPPSKKELATLEAEKDALVTNLFRVGESFQNVSTILLTYIILRSFSNWTK
jgi:hypothetical protein